MKALIFLLLLSAPFVLAEEEEEERHHNHDKDDSPRLCPVGYTYAGEDTPPDSLNPEPRDSDYYELSRTPVYSCYKMVWEAKTWLSAMHTCWEDDAQLVSFEDGQEMVRVLDTLRKGYYDGHDDNECDRKLGLGVFTSGMYFTETSDWYWIGSNTSLRNNLPVLGEVTNECLVARQDAASPKSTMLVPVLASSSCFGSRSFVCEARVQTVTYATWFVANWVDFLLGFLLVILFVALCISICAYTSNDHGRQSAANRRNRGHNNHHRNRMNDPNFYPTVIDLPPSYDSMVKVGLEDDSRPRTNAAAAAPAAATPSRIDYYRNRGRELMARVYFYKEAPKH